MVGRRGGGVAGTASNSRPNGLSGAGWRGGGVAGTASDSRSDGLSGAGWQGGWYSVELKVGWIVWRGVAGWRGGGCSVGLQIGWIPRPEFEPPQEHKKNWPFFRVKNVVLTRCRCAQPTVCIHRQQNDHVRTLKILKSMSDFGGLRKHEKTQHALVVGLGSAALAAAVA